jgi:hypothetical protein
MNWIEILDKHMETKEQTMTTPQGGPPLPPLTDMAERRKAQKRVWNANDRARRKARQLEERQRATMKSAAQWKVEPPKQIAIKLDCCPNCGMQFFMKKG